MSLADVAGSMLDPTAVPRRLNLLAKHIVAAGQKPLNAYLNVAGAAERGVEGAIGGGGVGSLLQNVLFPGQGQSPGGIPESLRSIGRGAKAGVAGSDPAMTDSMLRNMGIPLAQNGMLRTGEHWLAQGVADPANLFPFLDPFRIAGAAAKAAKLGEVASKVPITDKLMGYFDASHPMRKYATRGGENIIKGHEAAERNTLSRAKARHQTLVDQHLAAHPTTPVNPTTATGPRISPGIDNETLRRAFREGNASVRRKAMKAGYVPTTEEAASKPLGILTNFRRDYVPKQKLKTGVEEVGKQPSAYERIRKLAPKPGYNLPQKVGDVSTPIEERVLDRLNRGARHEQYYATRDKIMRDLGLTPNVSRPSKTLEGLSAAVARGDEKNANRYRKLLGGQHEAIKGAEGARETFLKPGAPLLPGTNIPQGLHDRLFGEEVRPQPTFAKDLADLQREALFAFTSLPHKKNISVLQMMGPGGAPALARGLRHSHLMKKGDPKTLERVQQLEQVGGTEHHALGAQFEPPGYEKALGRLGPVGKKVGGFIGARAKGVNEALERFDTGQRLGLEDALKKQGHTGFDAGGEIRDVLGDYGGNESPFARDMRQRLGAAFPHWSYDIVPKATHRAIMKQPRTTRALARGETDFNADVMEPTFGTDLHVGGPLEEGLGLFANPAGYATSPSRLGVYGQGYTLADQARKGKLSTGVSEVTRSYVPGLGIAQNLTGTAPYPANTSPVMNTLLGLPGMRLNKAKRQSPGSALKGQLRDQLQTQGVPQPAIDLMMRRLQLSPKL
jgi:hypothetical protein